MARPNINAEVVTFDGTKLWFPDLGYISFVNEETFAGPLLISDERVKQEGFPVKILYVNVNGVAAVHTERTE